MKQFSISSLLGGKVNGLETLLILVAKDNWFKSAPDLFHMWHIHFYILFTHLHLPPRSTCDPVPVEALGAVEAANLPLQVRGKGEDDRGPATLGCNSVDSFCPKT